MWRLLQVAWIILTTVRRTRLFAFSRHDDRTVPNFTAELGLVDHWYTSFACNWTSRLRLLDGLLIV